MIRTIPLSQLRIGMFVDCVEGHWLQHSLWRTKFLVADARQLETVVTSGALACRIDTAKGIDIGAAVGGAPIAAAVEAVAPAAAAVAASPASSGTTPTRVAAPRPVSMEDEVVRATQLCRAALRLVESMFADARRGRPPDIQACQGLVDEVVTSIGRHSAALTTVVRMKTKDEYLHLHSVAVCALMVALGRELGLDDDACRRAGLAGLLHDVGKAMIPQSLLDKPGSLSDAEFSIVRTHPAWGHALLLEAGVDAPDALDVALNHHEKIAGGGYPGGLASDTLSPMARMSAVCDVYDAVTSNRPYKEAWDAASALARMASWEGHFDRVVLAGLIKSVGVYPVGSLVRLASGRLAVVAENRPPNLRAPTVRVFYSTKSAEPVPLHLLDLQLPDARDRIVALEPREQWNFPHIDRLWSTAR